MSESKEESTPKSFLTLTLDTGDREFQSLEELENWVNDERTFFGWMEGGARAGEPGTNLCWNVTEQWMIVIQNFIQQYRQHEGNKNYQINFINDVKSKISLLFNSEQLITSKNPIAIFGKNISEKSSDVVACYAINNLLNLKSNQNTPTALYGAFLASQYLQDNKFTLESNVESLEKQLIEWNSRFNETHLRLREDNEKLVEEIERLREQFNSLINDLENDKTEQREKLADQIEQTENTLSDIAQTYDEKLALQSSVSYWKGKRKSHTKVMLAVGVGTLVLALLTGGGFIYAAHSLLNVTASQVELWRLGVILAISTFGIWITRLAAKIFISNLHLRTDADERITMIQTYLALLREGSGPRDEERQLILQTLFRPSNTGFIKDEGPTSFHELINRLLTKSKT